MLEKRILYVEDDEDALEMAALALANYRLTIARNFDDGSRLSRHRYFDLYILDNWLPDGSGIELCRRIRAFDPHTPVLFLSAAAYGRDVREALNVGAQIYLTKPIDLDDLEREVAKLISDAGENAFEAKLAELGAIREELAIRCAEDADRVEKAKRKFLRAEEKALRAIAAHAFLAAGGTRGELARQWPSVFLEEIRNHRAN